MIIITGPTASGKTALVEDLAKKYKIRIVNADVAQMYSAVEIGTAKPTNSERGELFDICSTPENTNVVEYRKLVEKEMYLAKEAEETLVLVGGSFFYLKSLLFKLSFRENEDAKIAPSLLKILENIQCETLTREEAYNILLKIDKDRAEKIGSTDLYRLQRALMIAKDLKVKPSSQKAEFDPISKDILIVMVNPGIEKLSKKISLRAEKMLGKDGGEWLEEVRKLKATEWESFIRKKSFIGYKELLNWDSTPAEERISFEELLKKIVMLTRNYAKRQICFWKGLKKELAELQKNQEALFIKMLEVEQSDKLTDVDLREITMQLERL